MYTIFKNDCIFYLTDDKDFSSKSQFFRWEEFDLTEQLKTCNAGNFRTFYLYHRDIEFLWEKFQEKFTIIEAAGGVVISSEGKILFIYRNEKWDLPKGKVEKGESVQEAALREVKEECGIKDDLSLGEYLGKTYHIYEHKKKEILKISHWFKMYSDEKELTPQFEEDITRVVWKDSKDIQQALKNTYPNIVLLIEGLTATGKDR